MQSVFGFLISTYGNEYGEINMWKQTHVTNQNVLRAIEGLYKISTLRTNIPLNINLDSEKVASVASLCMELMVEEDFILMDSIFNNKTTTRKPLNGHTNTFEIMIFLLVQNVVDKLELNGTMLEKFREAFEKKFIFTSYSAKIIHIMRNGSVLRLSLPEYLYLGFYAFASQKGSESDFETKVKCLIKNAGDRKKVHF
ncbi:hypothetical protein NGRA_0364 [Nosema granulosis]|uniref:Uncharacterized protein n=1 Tax=Nosema granulosis TaxID=83296 RepID=A0A9P6KZM7_9MICR|nr:hypothetical protein NGRA_0364 [Nosema granulosis]